MNENEEVNEILLRGIGEAQKIAYEKGVDFKMSAVFDRKSKEGSLIMTYSVTLELPNHTGL